MLDEALEWLAPRSRGAAASLLNDVLEAADSLAELPDRGRLVPELSHPELRELFIQRYRLIYRVTADMVQLIAFVHGARDFNRLFGDDQ